MEEYNVSLRIKDYIKNIWTVRKYFIDKYRVDPPVINGEQMPHTVTKVQVKKTFSLKFEEVFVKENYMLSRESYWLQTALK